MKILNEIIDWVEQKPIFWQVSIDKLIRNNFLSDSDITELKKICKYELGLINYTYTPVNFKSLRQFVKSKTSHQSIIISKISNIDNISALSNTNCLEFDKDGVTIVYGDNGAGKSSYASILKHVCNTRGNKPPINGNLFNNSTYNNDKKADVEYTTDNKIFSTVQLKNSNISDLILKSVDVFDTFSANHYIENEDEVAFIPHGLSIVEKLADSIKKVEDGLNFELSRLSLSRFDYLKNLEVPENSKANEFLKNLNSTTTFNNLRAESQWNNTKSDRLKDLQQKITKLKATDPKQELKTNQDKIIRFTILKDKFKVIEHNLSGETLENIKTTLNNFVNSGNALKESSDKVFSDLPLEGVGNQTWKILWESARKFYNKSKKQELFPEKEGTCPLCLQSLNSEAKLRFENFEEFVKNDIQQNYDQTSKKYNSLLEILNKLSFNFKDQEPTINELDDVIENYKTEQEAYIKQLSDQKNNLIEKLTAKVKIDSIKDFISENNVKTKIEKYIINLQKINVKLRTQSITEILSPLEEELNELIGQKKIYDFRIQLAREIFRKRKLNLLKSCISKCNTRTITTLSNTLASSHITKNLKANFKLELKKLGFNNIKIETETRGSKGKQYHFLKLDEQNSDNVSLKDILSEGEHRCIALATFLSELSLSDHKSSIIFDDPVSSLDHKWRNRIAKRIAEEALIRQVIVFTHDITFLLMLQEHTERMSCPVSVKSLTRKKTETGIIANNPPWDALTIKKRIGILNFELQLLEKTEKNETEEIYQERVKPFYGKLRESWERLIEEVLLNKVIQRFGREIQTKRLKVLSDLTDNDYQIIETNMKKCSTYLMGHDSSSELIESVPLPSEIRDDLKILVDYLAELRLRKRN